MSDHDAVLNLIFRAQNLAEGAVEDLKTGLDTVVTHASSVAGKISGAFSRLGPGMTQALGQSVEQLASGGSLGPVLAGAGAMMAGEVAMEFGAEMLSALAGPIITTIAPALAGLGTAAGGIIAAAIPLAMAALPFLLIGALVAAVGVLIVNQEIRNKVIGFVGGLVGTLTAALGKALAVLPAVIGAAFGAAWKFIVTGVAPFIAQMVTLWLTLPFRLAGLGLSILQTIVGGLAGLPGRVAAIVGDAFRSLKIDIGPFHISGGGVTIDLPKIDIPHFAGGVTNFAGGLARVGELGPELVRLPGGSDVLPTGAGTGSAAGAGVRLVGVSEADILDMVDRGLYFRLRRAGIAS
jgi:hypothetical protein